MSYFHFSHTNDVRFFLDITSKRIKQSPEVEERKREAEGSHNDKESGASEKEDRRASSQDKPTNPDSTTTSISKESSVSAAGSESKAVKSTPLSFWFPERLLQLLSMPGNEDAARWNSNGETFCIVPRIFEEKLLHRFFPGTKFGKFQDAKGHGVGLVSHPFLLPSFILQKALLGNSTGGALIG